MQYDFDKYMERRGTECEKWDGMTEDFGTNDLLAMWVADMDFPAAPEILDAIRAKLDEGALGYPLIPDSLRDAVRAWVSIQARIACPASLWISNPYTYDEIFHWKKYTYNEI